MRQQTVAGAPHMAIQKGCFASRPPPYNVPMRVPRLLALSAILSLFLSVAVRAGVAPFDLAGPNLEVTVTRHHETLPISDVPNLAVGDHLWIRADLPATQSERYLLIVAFLRGATNPPPERWFHGCSTWEPQCARRGLTLTVPRGAEQVLVFLAPETNGDYRTLVGAVRGRPGAFVRTSQDLNQATLDIARLDRYLDAIQFLEVNAPERLKDAAPKLARSLAIKVNTKCLQRIPQLQAPCLMRGGQSLILNDGHSTSIVDALTSGPASALAMEASYTPQLSYGYYSPYIASVIDIARIFSSFTTAQYEYIPALAAQHGDVLALTLNTPPSFHDPKSVLVTALPAIEAPELPPLHAVNPQQSFCIRHKRLILPVEGAPLVFSTSYAHRMRLRLTEANGHTIDLPAWADAEVGGFVVDTGPIRGTPFRDAVEGMLHGDWGFSRYQGPRFRLENASGAGWSVATPGDAAVIVGREDSVRLTAPSLSCLKRITVRDSAGTERSAAWTAVHTNEVKVQLPLKDAQPGPLTVLLSQFGTAAPVRVPLDAYSMPASLDSFVLHAGDSEGVLKGSRLDEVARLTLDRVVFVPGALKTHHGVDQLTVTAEEPKAAARLKAGEAGTVRVQLKDGRVLTLDAAVAAPRPSVALMAKSVYLSGADAPSHIHLGNGNELPQHAQLTFSVRAVAPMAFDQDESIQVATTDGLYSTTLSLTNGGITLENQQVAIATLDPARAFGPSAFGPLQFRVIDEGVKGGWQPLATLVRLPQLHHMVCPATPKLACKLTGSDLFLVDAIANDPAFHHAVQVPDGFPGYALPVPHPADGELYVKLRDDPSVVNVATVAVDQLPAPHKAATGKVHPAARKKSPQTAAQTKRAKKAPVVQTSVPKIPSPKTPESKRSGIEKAQNAANPPPSVPSSHAVRRAGVAEGARASAIAPSGASAQTPAPQAAPSGKRASNEPATLPSPAPAGATPPTVPVPQTSPPAGSN